MTETHVVTLDDEGRVQIPASVRERMGLAPGATLTLEASQERDALDLRLVSDRDEPELVDKDGVLVVRAEAVGNIDVRRAIEQVREERIAELSAWEYC